MNPLCQHGLANLPELITSELRPGDAVLLSLYWKPLDGSFEIYSNLISRLSKAAQSVGSTLIVELPLPVFKRLPATCTMEWFRTDYTDCSISTVEYDSQRLAALSELRSLEIRTPNLRLWDTKPFLCGAGHCPEFSAERPLFRDTNHLAYWGAKYLGVPFSDFLNKEWLTPPNVKPDAYHTEVL